MSADKATRPFFSSSARAALTLGEVAKHVVVAGGGVVVFDLRMLGARHAAGDDVDAAAQAQARGPAGAGSAAVGLVVGHLAVRERDTRGVLDEQAAPEAVAAFASGPPLAARGPVVGERTMADGNKGGSEVVPACVSDAASKATAARPAGSAVAARPAGAADGLVVREGAVANG